MTKFISFLFSIFMSAVLFSQTDTTLTIYFESNSYQISEINKAEITRTVRSIKDEFSIQKSMINGYCDDVGSDEYNSKLSQLRANSVLEILSPSLQLAGENLLVDGKGEIHLTEKRNLNSENQRSKNRKAEITLYLNPKASPVLQMETISEPEIVEVIVPMEVKNEKIPSYLDGDLKVGDKIVLEGILFEGNKDIILEESVDHVQSLLNELLENPQISVQIQGHIYDPYYYDPNFKSPDTNNLSERRARKIYQFLKKNGVANKRLSYVGFEGKYPLGGDPKFDRRVEIEITEID